MLAHVHRYFVCFFTHTLLASQGVSVITKLITNGSDIVVDNALDLVLRILSLGGQNVKRDFCRLFANIGFVNILLDKLSTMLQTSVEINDDDDEDEVSDEDSDADDNYFDTVVKLPTKPHIVETILTILFILSMFGDSYVKTNIAKIIDKLIKILSNLRKKHRLIVLQIIRNISIDLETQDILTAAGVLQVILILNYSHN
jgi:hypothetical protein